MDLARSGAPCSPQSTGGGRVRELPGSPKGDDTQITHLPSGEKEDKNPDTLDLGLYRWPLFIVTPPRR